jgi:hypothetical protein
MTYDAYFLGASGTRYNYSDMANRIRDEAPQTLGQHVSVQLEAIGLLEEFQNGITPCGLPFTFADNPRIMKFSLRHDAGLPDHVFLTLDDRFDVALIRTPAGLRIEVFPITGGEPWMDPCDRFEVDEAEIRELERELAND